MITEQIEQRTTTAANILPRLTRREAARVAQRMIYEGRRDGAMAGVALPPEAALWAKACSEALSAVFAAPDGEPFRFVLKVEPNGGEDKSASVSWTASSCDITIFAWPACMAVVDQSLWPAAFLYLCAHDYTTAVKLAEPGFDFGGLKDPAESLFKDAATTTPAQRAKAALALWN